MSNYSVLTTLLFFAGLLARKYNYKDEVSLLDSAEDTDKVYIEDMLPVKLYYNLKSIEL